MTAGLVDIGLY